MYTVYLVGDVNAEENEHADDQQALHSDPHTKKYYTSVLQVTLYTKLDCEFVSILDSDSLVKSGFLTRPNLN
jgi:hypothetical protein